MARWDERGWLRLLTPLAWIYGLGWWLLQRWHRGSTWTAPVPVISVGNLSVGGTGKSPLVQALARRIKKAHLRPAVLLRGYRAAAGPRPLAVSLGAKTLTGPQSSGDEAQEHARQKGVAVWIGPDRVRSAQAAIEAGAQALILDDGFQRRYQLARDLDLLLADWSQLQAGEHLLPAGPWREPWSQVAAADAVLISGAPAGLSLQALREGLPQAWQDKPLFRLELRPRGLQAWPQARAVPLSRLKGKRVAALSGLGNPGRFEASLSALGAQVLPWRFADHHPFSPAELSAQPESAQCIVCTRKDAQRLPMGLTLSLPLYILDAEAEVSPAAPFNTLLRRALQRRPMRGNHV